MEMPSASFLRNGRTEIAGQLASYVDYFRVAIKPAGTVSLRDRMYYILYDRKLIVMSFGVSKAGRVGQTRLERDFKKYEKLFLLMASSFDILNRYD